MRGESRGESLLRIAGHIKFACALLDVVVKHLLGYSVDFVSQFRARITQALMGPHGLSVF